jgi:hypothetical protein
MATRFFFLLFMLHSSAFVLHAQVGIDTVYTSAQLRKSLSFAQLTLGGDLLYLNGATRQRNETSSSFGPTVMPRITVGGLHFWGHADFYVSFPIGIALRSKPDGIRRYRETESVETGMKIYPRALRPGRLCPYAGISFQPFELYYSEAQQAARYGPAKYNRFVSPLELGLTYNSKKYLFTAALRYRNTPDFKYYHTPDMQENIRPAALHFRVGLLRYMDTDIGMSSERGTNTQNIMYHILKKHHKLSSWYWAAGPSTALQMSKSPFLQSEYPYLADNRANSFLVPDLSFGYYFSKADLNLGLSARGMQFRTSAFEQRFRADRAVVSLESYKFLFNYHGFVPFVGPMLSMEYLHVQQNGHSLASSVKPALGVVFGWDIRVTKTGTGLLRTNLRYTPGLHLDVQGKKWMYNHLEFNFIQMVHFIGRKKLYRQYSSNN